MDKRMGRQDGAVLIGALILLLVITIVGFSVMETSNLESKMATARELKEISFQTAEAIIGDTLTIANLDYLAKAFGAKLTDPNDPTWPKETYSYSGYDYGARKLAVTGTSEMRYLTNASTVGYSIRKGSSGIETYYYELEANSSLGSTNIANSHTQGVYVEAPRLN